MPDDETFRSMIRHEDEQTHRRLSWLGSFQGFLFASLGFCWGKNTSLTLIICLLGLAVALLIYSGVFASVLAIKRIHKLWHKHKPPGYSGPDISGFFPDRAQLSLFTSPEMLLPLTFAGAWISVIAIL